MRFCLIDADADYRRVLRHHLEAEWPDAGIAEFDEPAAVSPANEAMADCDAILLGIPLPGRQGLDGVERFLGGGSAAPLLLFAAEGDELLAVDAMRAGAASYFPKHRVSQRRLIETLGEVIGVGRRRGDEAVAGRRGQYRFIEILHSTGAATVYLAEPLATGHDGTSAASGTPGGDRRGGRVEGRRLAVKLIRYVPDAGSEALFDRFLQEYELIAGIDHPNVVRIFDLGIADDHAYIAMEYLGGGRLSDRLGQPLDPWRALDYLAQIAGALEAVHAAGILHRDLKPANIMFRDDGSLALIDFGLAKWIELEAALTGRGKIFGTPHYMSPEQGHAEATDARADLYSLGCILFEMLTGLRPFTASTAMGVIYLHANARRPSLPPSLAGWQALLDGLLAVDPAARFQSARGLIVAIEALRLAPSRSAGQSRQ